MPIYNFEPTEFLPNKDAYKGAIFGACCAGALTIFYLCIFGVLLASNSGPLSFLLLLLFLACVLYLVSPFGPLALIFTYGASFQLFNEGMFVTYKSAPETIWWKDVSSIRWAEVYAHGYRNFADFTFTVSSAPYPQRILLTESIQNLRELISGIERHTYPWLFPKALQDFRKGKTVYFHHFGISSQGLHFRSRSLPWEKVRKISLSQNRLVIFRYGRWWPWLFLHDRQIANRHIIRGLLNATHKHVLT